MQLDSRIAANLSWSGKLPVHIQGRRHQQEELRQALDTLRQHELASDARFAPDGSLLVIYPRGYFPTALRIAPIRGERLHMVERAIRYLNLKLEKANASYD